jgi:predicted RNA-binding Zn-ribbon protein involved in translation (DUF1610 family)
MTNQTNIITCPACGAPSEPEAGKTHMPCTYCGTTLTIPESLRTKTVPLQKVPAREIKFPQPEIDPSDLLRKAQPIAYRAFNLYALWTWVRWLLPACLTAFILLIVLCLALGALPVILRLIQ